VGAEVAGPKAVAVGDEVVVIVEGVVARAASGEPWLQAAVKGMVTRMVKRTAARAVKDEGGRVLREIFMLWLLTRTKASWPPPADASAHPQVV